MKRIQLFTSFLFLCSFFASAQVAYEITDMEVAKKTGEGQYTVTEEWARHTGYVVMSDKKVTLKDSDHKLLELLRTCKEVVKEGEVEKGITYKQKKAAYLHDELGEFWVSFIEYSDGDILIAFYYGTQRKRFMVNAV